MIRKLPTSSLRWQFTDLNTARDLLNTKSVKKQGRLGALVQQRALAAIELGLGIKQRGYNIFVVGASGTGRTSTVNQLLNERARKEPTAEDIVLLYNFNDRDRPLAVSLPTAMGPKLKKAYDQLVDRVVKNLETAFEAENYVTARQLVEDDRRIKTDDLIQELDDEAAKHGFVLSRETAALTITPAHEDRSPFTEEEFQALPDEKKFKLEDDSQKLEALLEEVLRRIRVVEKEADDVLEKLDRETAGRVLAPLLDGVKAQWKHYKSISDHLDGIRNDILSRVRRLIPEERFAERVRDNSTITDTRRHNRDEDEDLDSDEPPFLRYRVNVLITHSKLCGSPVVHETHPTLSNLIGRIEQRVRAGETITDFTRIRAGALYRANGGYLLLEAQELLRDLSAWEGLKRALKNRAIELDDPGEPGRMVSVAALRPEPVALNMKVILIGTPEVYYGLAKNDPDFAKLFKVKADFDIEMDLSREHIGNYLSFLSSICAEEKLSRLTAAGAGRVIERAVRLAGNQKKLTTRLGDIADLVREANYWAEKEHAKQIDACHVKKALDAKAEREGFLESRMLEDIVDGRVIIETEGEVVGQVNALTVVEMGNYEFGVPLRITCRVASGRGEIIDIERETELGGPLHTKGTLILRGILADRFGKDVPLGISATLCMEQTYSDVDGDSASLAETCALFSILAHAPIAQRFAITGSVDQRGNTQAVGGINEKIEGFYRLCHRVNSSGIHGVIIPQSNISDLMLSEDVVAACEAGTFVIHAIDNFEDALELLSNRAWSRGENPLHPAIRDTLIHLHRIRTQQTSNPFEAPLRMYQKRVRVREGRPIGEEPAAMQKAQPSQR